MNTLIVYWLSNVLKFFNYSDCFRVTRNLGGDGFAQSRSLFGEGTKEEEQRAREGNAAAGFVPDGTNHVTCFSNPKKTYLNINELTFMLQLSPLQLH